MWRLCLCVCVCVCVSACVYVCVFVRVYVLGREWSWVFASTALVVVWTAMYLTRHSDYLTGFHEPLSTSYICHTGLKTVYHNHWFWFVCNHDVVVFVVYPV